MDTAFTDHALAAALPDAGAPARQDLLRFITCGSVDDGKSTLIGRLLYESKMLYDDQLASVCADSRKWGTQGGEIDFALLVDGLAAEREQGITIDVAYRFFETPRRKFIVLDAPGHEQYTRNMVTGASGADAALVLVDARHGVLTQTRRHSHLLSLLGVRHVVLVVNKMDLVGYDQAVFDRVAEEYLMFAAQTGLANVSAIPMCALRGENLVERSARMPWYRGPTLREYLEQVPVDGGQAVEAPFRMPVQWVNRPHADFRGFAGMVASGVVRPGDAVRVLPSGVESRIARILGPSGELEAAQAGQSVTLTLASQVDVSRGDVIATAQAPCEVADQFEATLVWMGDQPMLPGRSYLMKIGACKLPMSVTSIKFKLNVNNFDRLAAKTLALNEIGMCNISVDRAIPFDPYTDNRDTGGFIVIDRLTHATVGAGMLRLALRRSHNIHLEHLDVGRDERAALKHQRPCVLWFTGLSGAGKSKIANAVEKQLYAMGHHTYLLDGDNVRHGLNRDLGFTDADRVENIRRVGEVAALMADAGLIVLAAFISPFRDERALARHAARDSLFIEVFVDTPLEVAEARDVKGLYRKARSGQLKGFTGIDSPYEVPEAPELRIDTTTCDVDEAASRIIELLHARNVLGPA